MPASNAWQRSLQAAESAGRLLTEVGLDQTRQVDVFALCELLGLWLTFLPMEGLLGAYVPQGAGGVIITDRRPITVQRYTAAHEIGHWRLEHGHGLALDGEEHVFGRTAVERERLAQVFAASLLMPPPLIFALLNRIGAGTSGAVDPAEAYFVAREAGVSYEAAVRQLANLQVITFVRSEELLKVRPLAVKAELAGGRRPEYGYADVWPVDEHWNREHLSLRADDEVIVSLPENRSTGYRWILAEEVKAVASSPEPRPLTGEVPPPTDPADVNRVLEAARSAKPQPAPSAALSRARNAPKPEPELTDASRKAALAGGVKVVGDAYIPGRLVQSLQGREARRSRLRLAAGQHPPVGEDQRPPSEGRTRPEAVAPEAHIRIAATGRRLLGIRFVEPGSKALRLQHRSPYNDAPAAEEYVLHAVVEPHRHGFSIDQLVPDGDEPWVGQVRERKLHEAPDRIDDPERR
jgi:IrrE N-terminal-like domain